jgi:Flp pilus assembly protein TadG
MLKEMIVKLKNNEKGSASIEFIGIIPLIFMIMLVLWQFLISAYAVIVAQSAVNEAAKVYSITENSGEAYAAASDIVNTAGSSIQFAGSSISGGDEFNAQVNVDIKFVFLPDRWFSSTPSYTFTSDASGKVIK